MHSFHTLLILVAITLPAVTAAAADPAPTGAPSRVNGGTRVRPYDRRAAALVVEGLRRSDRLRALIDELEERNVIVYVQTMPSLKGRLAGSLTWMTATKGFRYVRVSLNPELRGAAAIATLAHELQHALEVANESSIVDAASLTLYYKRNGISVRAHENGWDTEAARTVGDEVRHDLSVSRAGHIVESLQDFDPANWHIVYRRAREWRR